MSALLDRNPTVVPTDEDSELARRASRAMASAQPGELRVRLNDDQELMLPQSVTRLIQHLLAEMAQGNAVTLVPAHAELTTQEAADILNVSRPYLIALLEKSRIPFHMTGTHRRVRLTDLLAFKASMDQERQEAMDELAAQAQELRLGY